MKEMSRNLLQFFEFSHLPPTLRETSRMFCELAVKLEESLPDNPEKVTAIRKLLEAKDCAVRARIFKEQKEKVNETSEPVGGSG